MARGCCARRRRRHCVTGFDEDGDDDGDIDDDVVDDVDDDEGGAWLAGATLRRLYVTTKRNPSRSSKAAQAAALAAAAAPPTVILSKIVSQHENTIPVPSVPNAVFCWGVYFLVPQGLWSLKKRLCQLATSPVEPKR